MEETHKVGVTLTPSVLVLDENKGFGGAERHVLTLSRELFQQNVLEGVVARPNSWLAKNIESLPFHPVGFRNEVDMLSVYSIYRKLKSSGANVLHCIGHRDLVASALARQLPGAPPTVLLKAEHSFPDANLSPLFRWAYGQCQAVTSVSQSLQSAFKEALSTLDKVRTLVIPNGIDCHAPPQPPPSTEGRALHIGVLSALRSGKGQSDFLRAAARLQGERGDSVRFSIAGQGELLAQLELEASQLGLSVEFLGHLEEPESFLSTLDLSVIPSHKETFSLVTLESMFCGRPIVAADSDGVRELSADYPMTLYPVGDEDSLFRAMDAFCENPQEKLEAAQQASSRARQSFNSQEMAKAYIKLYQELLRP